MLNSRMRARSCLLPSLLLTRRMRGHPLASRMVRSNMPEGPWPASNLVHLFCGTRMCSVRQHYERIRQRLQQGYHVHDMASPEELRGGCREGSGSVGLELSFPLFVPPVPLQGDHQGPCSPLSRIMRRDHLPELSTPPHPADTWLLRLPWCGRPGLPLRCRCPPMCARACLLPLLLLPRRLRGGPGGFANLPI